MPLVFNPDEPIGPIPATIGTSSKQFTIFFTPPTVDARLHDEGLGFLLSRDGVDATKVGVQKVMHRLDWVTSWDGVVNKDGKPVPFSRKNLELAMADQDVFLDVISNVNRLWELPSYADPAPVTAVE